MENAYKLIEEGRKGELWTKYCGFLSLSRKEFKDIQNRLMLEQISLLGPSKIGKSFIGGRTLESLEEYRQITPLTTYDDYLEILKENQEEGLPVKPYVLSLIHI